MKARQWDVCSMNHKQAVKYGNQLWLPQIKTHGKYLCVDVTQQKPEQQKIIWKNVFFF